MTIEHAACFPHTHLSQLEAEKRHYSGPAHRAEQRGADHCHSVMFDAHVILGR